MKNVFVVLLSITFPVFLKAQSLQEGYSGAGHTTPSQTPIGKFYIGFASSDPTNYPASYGSILGYTKSANGYGYSYQIYKGHTSPELFVRFADYSNGGNNWFPWRRILDSGNDIESIGNIEVSGSGNNYINGNVGIGTNTPGAKLSIKDSNSTLDFYGDSSGNSYLRVNSGELRIRPNGSTVNKFILSSDRAYFANNVGIGTTTPSEKLEVNGSIRTKEVKVESTAWPDYVFSDTYQLNPLSEVSTYIQENHHLPGIPTAEEVAENGIKLGEMNAKLLEKVEELTLYQIQLLEMLEKQQKEIEILKSKVK